MAEGALLKDFAHSIASASFVCPVVVVVVVFLWPAGAARSVAAPRFVFFFCFPRYSSICLNVKKM